MGLLTVALALGWLAPGAASAAAPSCSGGESVSGATGEFVHLATCSSPGEDVSAELLAGPSHGTVDIVGFSQPDGGSIAQLGYRSDSGFVGTDSVQFRATSSGGGTLDRSVAIEVTAPVPAPPSCFADAGTVQNDQASIVVSCSDPDSPDLTLTIDEQPQHGEAEVVPAPPSGGSSALIKYTPDAGYVGGDELRFTASAGGEQAPAHTAAFEVIAGTDDAPSCFGRTVSVPNDSMPVWVGGCSDPDSTTLSGSITSPPAHGFAFVSGPFAADRGSSFSVLYSPEPGYVGPDEVAFHASADGKSAAATSMLQVTPPIDDPPACGGAPLSPIQNDELAFLGICFDPDSGDLAVTTLRPPAHGQLAFTTFAGFQASQVNVTYEPAAGFVGEDSAAFKATAGGLESAEWNVAVTVVAAVDDPPICGPPDSLPLQVQSGEPTFAASCGDSDSLGLELVLDDPPQRGELSFDPDLGFATYRSEPGYIGPDDYSFRVRADGKDSNTITRAVDVIEAVDDPPACFSSGDRTVQSGAAIGLGECFDPDSEDLTLDVLDPPAHGALDDTAPASNGLTTFLSPSYVSDEGYVGEDSVTFRASADGQQSAPVTVALEVVEAVDDPPQCLSSSFSFFTRVNVRSGSPRPVAECSDSDSAEMDMTIVDQPAHGTVSVDPATGARKSLVFDPEPGYAGVDGFTFEASADGKTSGPQRARVRVLAPNPNSAPVCLGGARYVKHDATDVVVGSCSDADAGDELTLTITGPPAHGAAVVDGAEIRYTPERGYVGADAVGFKASDGDSESNHATASLAVGPANDDPDDATPLGGEVIDVDPVVTNATREAGEPTHGADRSGSVWYHWEATKAGPANVDTCDSPAEASVAVYTGASMESLVPVASSADLGRCNLAGGAVRFHAEAGVSYLIAVGSDSGSVRRLRIGHPDNDDQGAATTIGPAPAAVTGTTAGATLERNWGGEPLSAVQFNPRASVWWRWTPAESGPVTLSTCGSAVATSLDVYEAQSGRAGSRVSATFQSTVASSACPGALAAVQQLSLAAGQEYVIAVSTGTGVAAGPVRLNVGVPANDALVAARNLDGAAAVQEGSTTAASREPGEPVHAPGGERSVWFFWNATVTGDVAWSTCGSDFDARAAVHRASAIAGASFEPCPSGPGGVTTVPLERGKRYAIALEGAGGQAGNYRLEHDAPPDTIPPETTIAGGPPEFTSSRSASFSLSADEQLATIRCAFDGEPLAPCESSAARSSLPDGQHELVAQATDVVGLEDPSPAVRRWTVDTTQPALTVTNAPAAVIATRDLDLEFAVVDATPTTVTCDTPAGRVDDCASPLELRGLPDGAQAIDITARDSAGNQRTVTTTIEVDATPPHARVVGAPTGPINDQDVTVSFAADEPATYRCALDDAPLEPCEDTVTFTGLLEGERTIRVIGRDQYGTEDPVAASATFTVDLTPPDTEITDQPDGPVHDDASFSYASDDPAAGFECAVDEGPFASCDGGALAGLPAGQHLFRVRALDPAGNADPSPAEASFTVTNEAPEVELILDPPDGGTAVGAPITVDLDAEDPDGDPLEATIAWGDGASTTSQLPLPAPAQHEYEEPSVRVVRVAVGDGRTETVVTRVVTVAPQEPVEARAGDDLVAVVGEPVRFDGAGSRPLRGLDSYEWDFGDGSGGSGSQPTHAYASAGTFTASLTVADGPDSDEDELEVRVVPNSEQALEVTVRSSGGAPVDGADVAVVMADGQRVSAVSGGDGKARLRGLPDGEHRVAAYANGFRPTQATGSVSDGHGALTIELEPGAAVEAELEHRRLTRDEIVDLGIDPNDPANQHIVEFEAHIFIDDLPPLTGNARGGGGGGGGGGGWFGVGGGGAWHCTAIRCRAQTTTATVTVQPVLIGDQPSLATLIIPFRASFLKEFYEVRMLITNLAEPGFTLERGAATLTLPSGLALAPTAEPQALTAQVGTIGAGETGEAKWILRGDEEGEYGLAATYAGVLEPVGRTVAVEASTDTPLKVWGTSAIKAIVDVDGEVRNGYPMTVRVGLENVADIPVYDAQVELLRAGRRGYIEQPRQERSYRAAEIPAGQIHWFGPFILVPEASGDVDLSQSFVKQTRGDPLAGLELTTHERDPSFEDTPQLALRRRAGTDRLVVDWDPVDGASDYAVHQTPDRETDFPPEPLPMTRPPGWDQTRAVLTPAEHEQLHLAVSSLVDRWTMVHPTNNGATDGSYPRLSFQDATVCGERESAVKLELEDVDFPIASVAVTPEGGEPTAIEVGQGTHEHTELVTFERPGDEPADITVTVTSADGAQVTEEFTAGECTYVALGDSFAAGQGVPEFEQGTAGDEEGVGGTRCHRSLVAYPRLILEQGTRYNGEPVTDDGLYGMPQIERAESVACSGAVIDDITNPNGADGNEGVEAQIDALHGGVDLVTISIGGNDALFADIVKTCVLQGIAEKVVGGFFGPAGLVAGSIGVTSCKLRKGGAVDSAIEDTLPRLRELYERIRLAAPRARVVVMEYPDIFPGFLDAAGCWGASLNDTLWMHAKTQEFNALIRQAAGEAGFETVELSERFATHDACKPGAQAWFNGVILRADLDPLNDIDHSFHPNARGHEAMAEALKEQLEEPGAGAATAETLRQGEHHETELSVPAGQHRLSVSNRWFGSDFKLTLIAPSGRVIERDSPPSDDVEHSRGETFETLTVTDPEPGQWRIRSTALDVPPNGEPVRTAVSMSKALNRAPVALATRSGGDTVAEGSVVAFDGAGSLDPDGSPLTMRWDYGDGQTGTGSAADHRYATPGRYVPVLTADDGDGLTDTYHLDPVTVEPRASATPPGGDPAPSENPGAPGFSPGAGGAPAAPNPGGADPPRRRPAAPALKVPRKIARKRLLRGMKVKLTGARAKSAVTFGLRRGRRAIVVRRARVDRSGTAQPILKARPSALKRLKRGTRLTLTATFLDATGRKRTLRASLLLT